MWRFAALDSLDLNGPPDLLTRPALAADRRGMPPEVLVLEAIDRAVEYDDWFLREVEKGLARVERGEVLTHEDVGARLERRLRHTAPFSMQVRWAREDERASALVRTVYEARPAMAVNQSSRDASPILRR